MTERQPFHAVTVNALPENVAVTTLSFQPGAPVRSPVIVITIVFPSNVVVNAALQDEILSTPVKDEASSKINSTV